MSNEQQEVMEKLGVDTPQEVPAEEPTNEAPAEETQEVAEEPQQEQPDGKERVDVEDPKVKARLDQLYGEMKHAKKQVDGLMKHNQQLEYALDKRLSDFESKQKSQTNKTLVTDLKGQIKEAVLAGDDDRAEELRERLVDIKAEEKIQSVLEPHVGQQRQQQYQPEQSPFTPTEEEYLMSLQGEQDESGQVRRPWMRDGHPDNLKASVIADGYLKQNPDASLYDVMDHLDVKMKQPTRPAASNSVGRSNLTPRPASGNMKLNDAQRTAARQLGISEAAYAKQLKLIQGA